MRRGSLVDPRGKATKELVGEAFTIHTPLERFIVVPHRHNNPFATVTESIWVLSGRRDIGFLLPYMPRAAQFSDDGETWRAAYGPRLRNWKGVDQIRTVVDLLSADPSSRRGVMVIFDPDRDFAESKDIPCNNWLHWMVREGALHLSVAVRSNDIVWGFSGINTFEWSLLQECMAHWLGVAVGRQHWLVSSMHVYEHHWERAESILESWAQYSGVYSGVQRRIAFDTNLESLDALLDQWFLLEEAVRTDPGSATDAVLSQCADPLLRAFLVMLRAYWLAKSGHELRNAIGSLAALEGTDIHSAAVSWLRETYGAECYTEHGSASDGGLNSWSSKLNAHIATLHAEKDAAYKNSWKKRGEIFSILPNIARKIDRLENLRDGASEGDEPMFETAKDAFVYNLKYCTFLLDLDEGLRLDELGTDWIQPDASDGVDGFERLLTSFEPQLPTRTVDDVCAELAVSLSLAEALATEGAPVERRLEQAQLMSRLSYELAVACAPSELLVGEQ